MCMRGRQGAEGRYTRFGQLMTAHEVYAFFSLTVSLTFCAGCHVSRTNTKYPHFYIGGPEYTHWFLSGLGCHLLSVLISNTIS